MVSKYASKTKKKTHKRKFYQWPKFWSFSRWKVFNDCKARYEYQFLQKLEQPESKALIRGIEVHAKGEAYLDCGGRVPKEFNAFSDEMKAIRKMGAVAEHNFAFTKTWQPTSPTDWNNCWLRIKIDARVSDSDEQTTLIDFKTGRPYKDTILQAELYAVGEFQLNEDVEKIDAEFWYVDSGEVVDYFFSRDDFKDVKKKWHARGTEMLRARQFPPTKNGYVCRYCPFRSDATLANGQPGPCEAWKKAK